MAIKMHEAPKGSCKRCGNCCVISKIRLDPSMSDVEAEFSMRRVGAASVERNSMGQLVLIFGPCPYLSKDRRTCLIYDTRPEVCKLYPPEPAQIVPGCHYFDASVEEN